MKFLWYNLNLLLFMDRYIKQMFGCSNRLLESFRTIISSQFLFRRNHQQEIVLPSFEFCLSVVKTFFQIKLFLSVNTCMQRYVILVMKRHVILVAVRFRIQHKQWSEKYDQLNFNWKLHWKIALFNFNNHRISPVR